MKTFTSLIAISCIVCALLVVFGIASTYTFSYSTSKTEITPKPGVQSDNSDEKLESELITASNIGFVPTQITRSAGKFHFVISNRTQLPNLSLSLSRIQGSDTKEKIKDLNLKQGQRNWSNSFNLPPGEYLLTETNHPDWKCNITIKP